MKGLSAETKPGPLAPHKAGGRQWKQRYSAAGLHFFDRTTGLNILFDEIRAPTALHARAPRQVSIALTNRCNLTCAHCYAPKSRDELSFDTVSRWLRELDEHGTLGIGFGGGEPTLHPDFVNLCQFVVRETRMSVSFTTHGHEFHDELTERFRGSAHFIRVSMDGVGATYESIRRRSFSDLLMRLRNVRSISHFGVNVVINDMTLPDIDEVASISADAGACELLLLPQILVRNVPAASADTLLALRHWIDGYKGPLKLCINESCGEGFPTCDPLAQEHGLYAYAHIDAMGVLKSSSYSNNGVQLDDGDVLQALGRLAHEISENDT